MKADHKTFGAAMVVLMFGTLSFSARSLAADFRVTISAEKAEFCEGEMIFLTCAVENRKGKEITVGEPSLPGALNVELVDQRGNLIREKWNPHQFRDQKIKVHPHGVVLRGLNLMNFGTMDKVTGSAIHFEPGKYRMTVSLDGVRSNTFRFEVVPSNVVDKGVSDRLNEILKRGTFTNGIALAQECENLARENPGSPYVKNMYWAAITFLFMYDRNGAGLQAKTLEMIRLFPNSALTEKAIEYFIEGVKREMKIESGTEPPVRQQKVIEERLKVIRDQFPQQRATQFLDQILNQ